MERGMQHLHVSFYVYVTGDNLLLLGNKKQWTVNKGDQYAEQARV